MSIHIQQPSAFDLVTNTIQIAGIAGEAFEAAFTYRVHEGHDELIGGFMAGDGVGGHGQFQISVDVSGAAFQLNRVFIEVFHESADDGAELDKVVVPAILGEKILPGYTSYSEHRVQAGETLWGIAAEVYGDGNRYYRLVAANPHTITNPNQISVGQIIRVPQAWS